MEIKIKLTAHQWRAIDRLLVRYLEMDDANREHLIRDIKQTGRICVFGYGSLIRDPHAKPHTQFLAYIEGYERGMVHSDRYYRGLPQRLGVTLGITPSDNPNHQLWGNLQIVHIDQHGDSEEASRRIEEYIKALASREVSLNPIYAYKILEVRGAFGTTTAIVCGTDPKSPQFIGPPVKKPGGDRLTYEEAAALIASQFGVYGASKRSTGIHYLCQVFGGFRRAGIKPDIGLARLASMANAFRDKLPRKQKLFLRGRELSERATCNRRLLGFDKHAASQSARTVERYRKRAHRKLGNLDPLSPERLSIILRNRRELINAGAANPK